MLLEGSGSVVNWRCLVDWSQGPQPCLTQWNYEPCHVGPPKTDRSWWRVLTKCATGEGNGKPLQYSCLEDPMNSMKRQKDRKLKDELPKLVGAQYATEEQRRNNSRKNEDLHDPDNHDGVNTHLEPDILEYEVKWALESITTNKASGGDGIPVEPFQILKDDAVKVLHSICQQIWKTQQWPQDKKRSVFIPIPKKGNPKACSNYHTVALISHASKVMLKILQAKLQ